MLLVGSLSLAAGCGKGTTVGAGRTEAERDSVLAGSRVPNAAAVKAALTVADSGRTRVGREDSISVEP